MADRKGDPSKQPPECAALTATHGKCPHLIETSSASDMYGETYHCDVCGEHYRLYYDDMA